MFETSVVRARAMSAHHRYRLLTLSLAFHGCAIVAAIAATLASTRLPDEAPRQMSIPILIPTVALPPALGTPHPKPAAPALRVIPETTPSSGGQPPSAVPVSTTTDSGGPLSSTGTGTAAGTGTGTDAGEGGPDGVPGGIGSGAAQPQSVPLRIVGDVKAPVVLQRVIPEYPRVAMMSRMNGWVILECIIDKTGHIRDARVLKSSFAAFEEPALDAVQKWVFTPGSLHGEPVDTIFDLTVAFQLR